MKLKDKNAVVTGAGRGIGRAVALAFAEAGANVVINYHSNDAKANEVVSAIRKMGREALAVQADVSRLDAGNELVDAAVKTFGGIDILVNNAGISKPAMFLDMEEGDWDRIVNIHLKGTFNCSQAAAKQMKATGGGKIINVISTAGLFGTVGQINYASAKAGIIGFTKSAARELGRFGINVNAICPGVTLTDMTQTLQTNEKFKKIFLGRIQLGRFSAPEEIAPPFVFLASDDASYVTGHVLEVTGGYIG